MLKLSKYTLTISFICFFALNSCGIYKYSPAKDNPTNADDRIKKNMEEGRGFRLSEIGKNKGGGNFQFASSNPMWRASLETLDFLPLVTVDYSGGVIISDWYTDNNNKKDSIKITLRFLSNEIQTNSIKVIVHQKKCDSNNLCSVNKLNSKIPEELKISILKKAALLEKRDKEKKK